MQVVTIIPTNYLKATYLLLILSALIGNEYEIYYTLHTKYLVAVKTNVT